jgi:hypothetical protein
VTCGNPVALWGAVLVFMHTAPVLRLQINRRICDTCHDMRHLWNDMVADRVFEQVRKIWSLGPARRFPLPTQAVTNYYYEVRDPEDDADGPWLDADL